MAWLAEQASAAGLTLALDSVNRYETNIANTAAEMLAYIDQTGADIGVHLDNSHMKIEENGLVEPVEQCRSRLRYTHIGVAPGLGQLGPIEVHGQIKLCV